MSHGTGLVILLLQCSNEKKKTSNLDVRGEDEVNYFFHIVPENPRASSAVKPPGPRGGSCTEGKTMGCALGFVELFCTRCLVCATSQGDTDGCAVRRLRMVSVGSVSGDASGHQMVHYVFASTSD